jgi:hypothetical protein
MLYVTPPSLVTLITDDDPACHVTLVLYDVGSHFASSCAAASERECLQ